MPEQALSTNNDKQGLLKVPGFRAMGVHAGIKKNKPDVALIVSDRPASAAAVFTKNAMRAAPVDLSKDHLSKGDIRAIIVNSGNANAATGAQGMEDARQMANLTAAGLGLDPHQVLVSSTGIIGVPLPMQKIQQGIEDCAKRLDEGDGSEVATAILTTDSGPKMAHRTVSAGGRTFTVAGMAKGSGMIHPNMATMLAFLTTDAPVANGDLQALLGDVVDNTFNMITVDGDESTNDMVAMLANGAEDGAPLAPATPEWDAFREGITGVCRDLARMIAADGEGASRLLEVQVSGAASAEDARRAARAVVRSNLVKSALHGGDPNWGRIAAAVGSTRIPLQHDQVRISIHPTLAPDQEADIEMDAQYNASGVVLFEAGTPVPDVQEEAHQVMAGDAVRIQVVVGSGPHEAEAWGCDLTEEYVRFNSAYST
jgi:glutamate N-acetyltransferase / amino-acid N-acetyltransferase